MNALRALVGLVAVVVALGLQTSLFPHLAWNGVVPNLVLLVVVAAALTRSPQFALVLGFTAGVLMDVVPPADHLAGRWALALVVVAWVAGRMRHETRPSVPAVLATVAASSFVGTSVFALTGLLLRDPAIGVTEMLGVVFAALVWDLVLTPVVLPLMMKLFDLVPERGAERVRV